MRKYFCIPLILLFASCGNLQSKKQLDVIREGLGRITNYDMSTDEIMAMIDRETIRNGDTATLKVSTFQFNTRLQQLTFDGQVVPTPDEHGVVHHSFIAKGKPGKYHITLKVVCVSPGGTRFEKTKRIAYFIEP